MKVRNWLGLLRAGWWLVALGVAVGLAAAQVVITSGTPLYRSTTQLFVGAAAATDGASAAYSGGLFAQQRVASYVSLIQSEHVAAEVISDLQLQTTPAQLAADVTGTVVPNTVILQVSVTDTSPRRAQAIAESWGRHVATELTDLEKPSPGASSTVKVTTIQPATFAPTGISPDVARDRGLGALLGLLAGLSLAALRVRRRSTVRGPGDVEAATGAPVLSAVAHSDRWAQRPVATVLDPGAAGPEEIRRLRTRVYPPTEERGPSVLVVTSAARGEGTATVAAEIAAAVVRAGRTALLVDADLADPWLSRELDCTGAEGMADVLAGTADHTAVIRQPVGGGPAFLPAGAASGVGSAGELLAAPKVRALLDTLRTAYDTVVLSAPPVLAPGDAGALGALGDGTLLVVRHGVSRRKQLAEAASTLSWYGADLLGAVLVHVPQRDVQGPGRRYRYTPDPYRARASTGSVSGVPFASAAPDPEEGRLLPESTPVGADPS